VKGCVTSRTSHLPQNLAPGQRVVDDSAGTLYMTPWYNTYSASDVD